VRPAPHDVGSLRDRLTEVEQQIRIIGLGEGGLIALSFGNLTPQIADAAPRWILGVLVTLLVAAGAFLARAWIGVHVASASLTTGAGAALPGETGFSLDPAKDAFERYTTARGIFRAAICLLALAGLCYLAAAWIWATAASGHSAVPAGPDVHGSGGSTITTLFFQFNSSALIPTADSILQPIGLRARSQHLLVSITGHASPDGGTNAYNKALSDQRANAVRKRLIALGLPAAQITKVTGVGTAGQRPDACLVEGQLDEAICAQLRRVVVVVYPAAVKS
jgi:outer membrane protein OmpA-like peptidoglycan-associated protein